MDWNGNRHDERFIYKRVKWSTFGTKDTELEEYSQLTGGSVEYGLYTDMKVTGSFSYAGEAPDTTDLLRVYYQFADDHGEVSEPVALGTFFIASDTVTSTPNGAGLVNSGTITGQSLLKPLKDRLCGLPMTIAAGSNPITKAAAIIKGCGLRVNYPKGTTYRLKSAHTFEPEDSYLTVVNWLLTNCSTPYQSAFVDGYGVVQVQPYEDPTAKMPVQTFSDDERSIMLPSVDRENDIDSSANVVRLYFESDTTAMWASASNMSGSSVSLDVRGNREVTYYEQVDEIADLDALKAMAVTRLKDQASEIEHVTLTHAYVPLAAGDSVSVLYGGTEWSGTVQTMRVNIMPSAQTRTTLRRYASAALEIETDGAVLWAVE